MNIPREVKIGGMEFEVKMVENMIRDRQSCGETSGSNQEIRLDSSSTIQLKESTFIHELLHSLDFVYNIGLEHQQIYQLETALYAFIKDNPDVLK